MQVFKVYFHIIKKNIPMLMIYIVVFVGMSIAFSTQGQSSEIAEFTEIKAPVAFISDDNDSGLIKGLMEYVGQKSIIVEVADNQEALQDALFFREVEYIIRIPAGFTERFMNGEAIALEKTSIPNSTSGIYMEMILNNFLNSANHYVKYVSGITQEELVAKVTSDLAKETEVVISEYESGVANGSGMSFFFNFAAYPVIIILIFGITSFMLVFNDTLRKRRTLCSPISHSRLSMETLLANLAFTVIIWVIMLIVAFAVLGKEFLSMNGLLWSINLFIVAVVGLSISFLIGSLLKNKTAQSAVANTFALGLSFLSGCFVPQSLLNDAVLSIGRFLPTFWYVRASDEIGKLKSFGWESIQPVIYSYLIQIGFAAALICIALVITRQVRSGSVRQG